MRPLPSSVRNVLACACLLWAMAGAPAASATTVCPAGPPACDFATIQAAVDATVEGGRVSLAPGTYTGSVVLSRQVTIEGTHATRDQVVLVGDGSGPVLTVGPGSSAWTLTIADSGAAAHAGVLLDGTDSSPAELWYSTVRDNDTGVLVPDGRRGGVRFVTIDAAAGGVGARVAGAGGESRLDVASSVVRGAAIGIEAVAASLLVEGGSIDVPANAIGIQATGAGYHQVAVAGALLSGDGRAGAVGVVLEGQHPNGVDVRQSEFRVLDTAIRVSDAPGGTAHDLERNLFTPGGSLAPIELASARTTRSYLNFVACPELACAIVRGVGASSAEVTPVELDVGAPATALTNTEINAWALFSSGNASSPTVPIRSPLDGGFDFSQTPGFVRSVRGDLATIRTPSTNGTFVVTVRFRGRPAQTTVHVLHPAPARTSKASITGAPRANYRVRCIAPTWTVAPTKVEYRWSKSDDWASGNDRLVSTDDVRAGRLTCYVRGSFDGHMPASAEAQVRTILESQQLALRPLNGRWRAMRCGIRVAAPCRAAKRIGVRFRVTSASRERRTASIVVQRRIRSGWSRWLTGTIPMPTRGGTYIPAKFAPPGSYRVRVTSSAHDIYRDGATRWSYWRIR